MERKALAHHLLRVPLATEGLESLSVPERIQQVRSLPRLHIPSSQELQIAETIQHMVHTGYRDRDPRNAQAWQVIYDPEPDLVAEAALVTGISGIGKSTSIKMALDTLPQVVDHRDFPKMVTGLRQLVWLKVNAPGSGRVSGLALNLLDAMSRLLGPQLLEGVDRHNPNSTALLRRAIQKAKTHFLGLLVIDEVQNLFKLSAAEERRKVGRSTSHRNPLRLVEDETLKQLLNISNDSGIPLLLAGTPDSIRGLQTRLANCSRLAVGGHVDLSRPKNSADPFFSQVLLPQLVRYQWLKNPLEMTTELRDKVFALTAGVPKLVVALWMHAQIRSISGGREDLQIADLDRVFNERMAFLRPAIEALLSGDPSRLWIYEDLVSQFQPLQA